MTVLVRPHPATPANQTADREPQAIETEQAVMGQTLRKSVLSGTRMEAATLSGAILSESKLDHADLTAAHFNYAVMPATRFSFATLNGTDFSGADLRASQFDFTTAQATVFKNAFLEAASFFESSLQGATFEDANLTGAAFDDVQLSYTEVDPFFGRLGEDFPKDFDGVAVSYRQEHLTATSVDDITQAVERGFKLEEINANVTDFANFDVKRRLERLKQSGEDKELSAWKTIIAHQPENNAVVNILMELSCKPSGDSAVAAGIIEYRISHYLGDRIKDFQRRVEDANKCPGAQYLSLERIKRINDEVARLNSDGKAGN